MKLGEFTLKLLDLLKENPEAADYDVVCSADDEGNSFTHVCYDPAIGHMDADDGFKSIDIILENLLEDYEVTPGDYPLNSVCVN